MSTCPYIKKNQKPCGIKLRNSKKWCYKHGKCINLPKDDPVNTPAQPEPKKAIKSKVKVLDDIINVSLAGSFNPKSNYEDESSESLDGMTESMPKPPTPQAIQKPKPVKPKQIKQPPKEEHIEPVYDRKPVKQVNLKQLRDSQLIDTMTDMLQSGQGQAREALEEARKRNIINSTQFNQLITMYL